MDSLVKKENQKKINYIVIGVAIVFTLFRVLLMTNTPMRLLATEIHDDKLVFDYGMSIAEGKYLGDYGNHTLVKGISFAVFFAISIITHIPYLLLLSFVYILAAVIVTKVLSYKIDNKFILLLSYLFVLYCPSGFASEVIQRFYRNSLVTPLVLIVFASVFGIYFKYKDNMKTSIKYAVLCGISLSFFYYLREDSIWIMPFILAASSIILVLTIIKYRLKYIYCAFIPVVLLFCTSIGIKTLNYNHYGIFAINDRSGTSFADMCSNLMKIKSDKSDKFFWVTKDMIDKAKEVSPTLKSLEKYIDEIYNEDGLIHGWINEGDTDIKGDLFSWAFRDVATLAGYYKDAKSTNELYKKINEELEQGFKDGKLEKSDAIFVSSMRGLRLNEIPGILCDSIKNLWKDVRYDFDFIVDAKSTGTNDEIREMEIYTSSHAIHKPTYTVTILGDIKYHNDKCIGFSVIDENDTTVYNSIKNGDEEIVIYRPNRASNKYFVELYYNDSSRKKVEIENYEDEDVTLSIKLFVAEEIKDYLSDRARGVMKISTLIGKVYRKLSLPILFTSAAIYCVYVVYSIRKKSPDKIIFAILTLGVAASILLLNVAVTIFTEWISDTPYRYYCFYSVGIVSLIKICELMCLAMLVDMINNKKSKENFEEKA